MERIQLHLEREQARGKGEGKKKKRAVFFFSFHRAGTVTMLHSVRIELRAVIPFSNNGWLVLPRLNRPVSNIRLQMECCETAVHEKRMKNKIVYGYCRHIYPLFGDSHGNKEL